MDKNIIFIYVLLLICLVLSSFGLEGYIKAKNINTSTVNDLTVNNDLTVKGSLVEYKRNIIDVTDATKTISADESGSIILINRPAGITFTLPQGISGLEYTFYIQQNGTDAYRINTYDLDTDYFDGFLQVSNFNTIVPGVSNSMVFGASIANSYESLLLSSDSKGRLFGGYIHIISKNSNVWQIDGILNGNGVLSHPFNSDGFIP